MSAVPLPDFEPTPQRGFSRHSLQVPLDLIALRSGVPETLPGRCTDISEAGVGAIIAGDLVAGQQVAVELRLPNVGVPVRARAVVRYQSRLRCGLEFSGLAKEQREMIRYWAEAPAAPANAVRQQVFDFKKDVLEPAPAAETAAKAMEGAGQGRRVRIGRRGFYAVLACLLATAGLGWWQWERSWSELETDAQGAASGLRVSPETMEKRMLMKIDPAYPEAARKAGVEGVVVLDAVISAEGTVKSLRAVSGPEALVKPAAEAVYSWKFEPYLADGKPVEVATTIGVEFRLR